MRFNRPLLRLPILFDADVLAREISALPRTAWVAHPNSFPGNDAVRLITPGGKPTDELDGAMAPTEHLHACPYILDLMAELGGTWGRSRLMGLAPGAEVPAHVDSHYYWRTHLRIHIPVITNSGVEFTCGGETVHMSPGECWVFDSFQKHEVHNRGNEHRVHLVLDTVGGRKLWELIDEAQLDPGVEPRLFRSEPGARAPLLFEAVNSPAVMSPWELRCHIAFLSEEAQEHDKLSAVLKRLDRLVCEWGALWAAVADSPKGVSAFQRLLGEAVPDLVRLGANEVLLKNQLPLLHVFGRLVLEVAVDPKQRAHQQAKPAQGGGFVSVRPRLAS
jgi:hypothetical protein